MREKSLRSVTAQSGVRQNAESGSVLHGSCPAGGGAREGAVTRSAGRKTTIEAPDLAAIVGMKPWVSGSSPPPPLLRLIAPASAEQKAISVAQPWPLSVFEKLIFLLKEKKTFEILDVHCGNELDLFLPSARGRVAQIIMTFL